MVVYFANRLFVSKIVSKVYQIRKYENLENKSNAKQVVFKEQSSKNPIISKVTPASGAITADNIELESPAQIADGDGDPNTDAQ